MCVETGVGGGQVYDEARLFISEAEALAAAQIMADKDNAEIPRIVDRYNKTLDISDYQLEAALLKEAKSLESKSRSMLWNLNDLFEQIAEASDKDAIADLVEDYKRYSWERDKENASEVEAA